MRVLLDFSSSLVPCMILLIPAETHRRERRQCRTHVRCRSPVGSVPDDPSIGKPRTDLIGHASFRRTSPPLITVGSAQGLIANLILPPIDPCGGHHQVP